MVDMSCFCVESLRRRRISIFFWAMFAALLLILLIIAFASQQHSQDGNYSMESSKGKGVNEPKNKALFSAVSSSSFHRKLSMVVDEQQLQSANEVEPNRIWGDKCSKSDIVINQGPTEPLPNGIPTYTVEIMNVCVTGCDISGIHLNCGWFSSARLINPRIFKRLHFNDCIVNDGKPLINGRSISFQYANSFPYPLSVSAVIC